jgi:hypothetical protein
VTGTLLIERVSSQQPEAERQRGREVKREREREREKKKKQRQVGKRRAKGSSKRSAATRGERIYVAVAGYCYIKT